MNVKLMHVIKNYTIKNFKTVTASLFATTVFIFTCTLACLNVVKSSWMPRELLVCKKISLTQDVNNSITAVNGKVNYIKA